MSSGILRFSIRSAGGTGPQPCTRNRAAFFFSSRGRHTSCYRDWSSDVCSSDLPRFRDRVTTRTELADKLLEVKVNSALTEEIGVSIAPTGVTVSAVNGRITLAGMSSSGALRRRAEKVAHQVAGVRQIDNRIVSVPTRGRGYAEAPGQGARARQTR